MSFMRLLAILSLFALVFVCYQPWVSLPARGITVTGMGAEAIGFGKPALVHLFFAALLFVFLLVNKLWSLRTAFFVGAINVAWSLRNYMALTACSGGLCPQKHFGIFALPLFSVLVLLFLLGVRKKGTSANSTMPMAE